MAYYSYKLQLIAKKKKSLAAFERRLRPRREYEAFFTQKHKTSYYPN